MQRRDHQRRIAGVLIAALTVVVSGTAALEAAVPVGEATVVRATTLGLLGGSTTTLAGTGPLGGAGDARDASLTTGGVPSILNAEVLDAVTVGWPDQATSQASLAGLGMVVGGTGITADMVMATATAPAGAAAEGRTLVENLAINGVAVPVTGQPNQTIPIPGGQVVINEQIVSAAGTTVNALHATVVGVADVVVASATAGNR